MNQLRTSLLETPNAQWISDAILDLLQNWSPLSEAVPALQSFPGFEYLEKLNQWLRLGKFLEGSFPLPNILLTPLVVITHLIQHSSFLDRFDHDSASGHSLHASLTSKIETLGLCTGPLSAAVV